MWRVYTHSASCLAFLIGLAFLFTSPVASAQPAWDNVEEADDPEAGDVDTKGEPNAEAEATWEGTASSPTESSHVVPNTLSLDAKLEALDGYLEEIDTPTRRYFYGWLTVQVGLVAGQIGIALASDDEATRGSYLIGSGVASASIGLLLIGRRPAMGAVKKYREMPSSTDNEKAEKLAMGEAALAGQAAADQRGTSWLRHLIGIGAAVGSGALVAMLYEHSLKLATQRVFATFFVSELQIITRPRGARRNQERYTSGGPSMDLSFAPMVDRHAQGLSLMGRF